MKTPYQDQLLVPDVWYQRPAATTLRPLVPHPEESNTDSEHDGIRNRRRSSRCSDDSTTKFDDRRIMMILLTIMAVSVLVLLTLMVLSFRGPIMALLFPVQKIDIGSEHHHHHHHRFPYNQLSHPDEVVYLPGANFLVNFRHYSGYLNAGNGSFFHYWFFESQNQPESDPVVLWLNGGPGCSSMIGALTENGPFRVANDGGLSLNPFSWNVRANLLYLESPAGVGFSFRYDLNYTIGDHQTAVQNLAAVRDFFQKFPHYAGNEFYVFGESYAGIYVPMLVWLMADKDSQFPGNLRGFAIGNGLMDYRYDAISVPYFLYYHGLIGVEHWSRYVDRCCPNTTANEICVPEAAVAINGTFQDGNQCFDALNALMASAGADTSARLNPYNIYANCRQLSHLSPCLDGKDLERYLNLDPVKRALNVKRQMNFSQCNDQINRDYRREEQTMAVIIKQLVAPTGNHSLKALIYNGDIDAVCNFLGSQWFAESLQIPASNGYGPWTYGNQIGGYLKRYGNLTVATIRGAGHMAPADRPGPAQQLFHQFLDQN